MAQPIVNLLKLWTVRYRTARGINEGVIEAREEGLAKLIAQRWVEATPTARFLNIRPFLLADESYLPAADLEAYWAEQKARAPQAAKAA